MTFQNTRCFVLTYLLFWAMNCAEGQTDTLYIDNPGDQIHLNGPPGYFAYDWKPAETLDNPTIANPKARPFETTTYIAEILSSFIGDNLIVNGTFDEGNTGFDSDYIFVSKINQQGVYGINVSAANLNAIYFEDCPDHTDGSGPMMVIDGSPIANEKVWCQIVQVKPETNYAFSVWLTSVNPSNPAELQFSFNGEQIGTTFIAGQQLCEWRQFYEIWNAGNATEAEICIVNQNTNPTGNDFALDDFSLQELESILYDTVVVVIKSIEAAKDRRVYFPNAFSPNQDGVNDIFLPQFGFGVTYLQQLKIFDRWGNLVFYRKNCMPNDRLCGWDGTFRGKHSNPGDYLYLAQVLYADKSSETITGNITLVR